MKDAAYVYRAVACAAVLDQAVVVQRARKSTLGFDVHRAANGDMHGALMRPRTVTTAPAATCNAPWCWPMISPELPGSKVTDP